MLADHLQGVFQILFTVEGQGGAEQHTDSLLHGKLGKYKFFHFVSPYVLLRYSITRIKGYIGSTVASRV